MSCEIAKLLLERQNNGEFLEQKTDKWYEQRKKMFTASEIASLLDCNIYKSCYDVILNKLHETGFIENDATKWGNIFEPVAIDIYKKMRFPDILIPKSCNMEMKNSFNNDVYSIGLVPHKKYKWLGASPDGLITTGKLLEIKCPIRRTITGIIPYYYWIQMQIQMEVCDINLCDYFECKFHKFKNKEEYLLDSDNSKNIIEDNGDIIYYKLTNYNIKSVKRDKKWFRSIIDRLESIYVKFQYYKTSFNGVEMLLIDSKKSRRNKRSITTDNVLEKKKLKLSENINNWDNWVSATKIRNYMIDDPFMDWIDYNYSSIKSRYPEIKGDNTDLFTKFIMKKGKDFEIDVISNIKSKFPNDFIEIASYNEARSYDKYIKTIESIKNGIPIIYQGVLHDYDTLTYGMPDLIVRCDYLNKLVDLPVTATDSKTYRIVEIKNITLQLCVDGTHIRNSCKNIYAFKGQIYIYNKILGKIQNHTPSRSYILCKKWNYKKNNYLYEGNTFDRITHINFNDNDAHIRTKTALAINWIRKLKLKLHEFEPYSRIELMPNMCNKEPKHLHIKKKIAIEYNDITLLWNCNHKNREIGLRNGVKNWKNHPKLTSEMLGVKGDKTCATLQMFLNLNQNTELLEPFQGLEELKNDPASKEWIIHPSVINNNMYNWKCETPLELFIDFEIINNEINQNYKDPFLFMIGIGYCKNNSWNFKCLIADNISEDSEKKILNEFHDFISQFGGFVNLYHWGNIEKSTHSKLLWKYNIKIDKFQWCDLLKLFKAEMIIVRGMLNFSIKSVAKSFYENGFINTTYDDNELMNGLDAMILAMKYYYEPNRSSSFIIQDIKKYNEIDCKILWEVITYLRNNNI